MNKGVEILLERMSSNPDEFLPEIPSSEYPSYPEKWVAVISAIYARKHGREGHAPFYDLSFLSDADIDALFNKLQEIRGDHFTKCVMSTLLTDDSSDKRKSEIGLKPNDKYVVELMKRELERKRLEAQRLETLTKTQMRLAEKLNIPYDDYAKKVSELKASA